MVRLVLVSSDIQIIDNFCRLAQALAIHVETCCDSDSAMRKLCHEKFEGVVLDLNVDGGADLLKRIRALTSNKSAVSFAILPSCHERGERFFTPANFVLERPLQTAVIFRVLKAAYPLLVHEKRRYFRYPVQVSVFVMRGSSPEFVVPSLNLSAAGICLNSSTPMQVGDRLRLRLQLPGDSEFLNLTGDVCWSESMGRVGIQFSGLTHKVRETLQRWLGERLEETLSQSEGMSVVPAPGVR